MNPFFESEEQSTGYRPQLLGRFLRYIRPYRGLVALAFATLVVQRGMTLVAPYLVKVAIDGYIAGAELPPGARVDGLLWIGALFAATLAGRVVFEYLYMILVNRLGQTVMHDLRLAVFRQLQILSLRFFHTNPLGRLVTRVTSDVQALAELLTSGIVAVLGDLTVIVGVVVILLVLHWKLALASFAVLPLLLLGSILFRRRARRAYQRVRSCVARLNAFLQEHLAGMRTVQLFGRQSYARERFAERNRELMQAHLEAALVSSVFLPMVVFLGEAAAAVVLWYGGRGILLGEIPLGTFYAFLAYLGLVFDPLSELAEKYNLLQGAMASAERIFGVLDMKPEIPILLETPPGSASPTDADRAAGKASAGGSHVEFREVSFGYDGRTVLDAVTFRIRRGERVAIVGPSGAGKTTLLSLLFRFYDTRAGEIVFEGTPVREWDARSLRRRMALVSQEPMLFTGTIAHNIRLGRTEVGEEKLAEVAERLGLGRWLQRLPGGVEAALRERGSNLSLGQRQLLCLARALVGEPSLVVFDEATSSVDAETETLLHRALETMLEGRTAVLIAHRLSTLALAERILVIDQGRLVEEGLPEELLQRDGLFAAFWQARQRLEKGLVA